MTTRRELLAAAGASLALTGCIGGGRAWPSSTGITSVDGVIPAEWATGAADSHGIPSSILDDVLAAGAATAGLQALVVVRNGVLIGERYYLGASATDLLPINSATKSVISILVGIALERRTLGSLDDTVAQLLPEAASQAPGSPAAALRLEDILIGRTGLAYDIFDNGALTQSPDPVALALGLPRTPPTASGWTYNDAVVGLLSPLLARAEGRDVAALAARDLFAPLGIERFSWRRDRPGRPLAYAGLALRTRDLAKIAWTMADGGAWRGRQVMPRAWVARSTQAHGPADWYSSPVTQLRYGYLWFSGSMNGRRVVWGWGYGGQFALFAPDLRLAVATAAISPARENLTAQTRGIMTLVGRIVGAAT